MRLGIHGLGLLDLPEADRYATRRGGKLLMIDRELFQLAGAKSISRKLAGLEVLQAIMAGTCAKLAAAAGVCGVLHRPPALELAE